MHRAAAWMTGGTASYNALFLSIQRRRNNGVTVHGNYTLAHCIGDQVIHVFSGGGANRTRDLERGDCAGDGRHLVRRNRRFTDGAGQPAAESSVGQCLRCGEDCGAL
jgi:hypothetical protein